MNKPVAWKIKWDDREWLFSDDEDDIKMSNKHKWQSIPLYTHPVKELTDEVKDALFDALNGWKYIRECHGDLYGVGWDRVQDKLEAILRKAQEK